MTAIHVAVAQMRTSWHEGGMFIGMHWIWWLLWILTIGLLLWGFWRMFADRREAHRRTERTEAAEEALRRRFAEGEIDEDEFVRRMRMLRENTL